MPWVKFHRDFNWRPPETGNRVSIAYKAGSTYSVRKPCADEAVAKLYGELVERDPEVTAPKGRRRKRV